MQPVARTCGRLGGALVLVAASAAAIVSSVGARTATTRHLEYVVDAQAIFVYDIDRGNRLVKTIPLPGIDPRGVEASPKTGMLYISYGGSGGSTGNGSLLKYDLVHDKIVWQKDYGFGIDSFAITPNGRTIYMPGGESGRSNTWRVIDARTGRVTGAIHAGSGPHDTIVGHDGKYVYLGGVNTPYLEMASTATNKVVRKIGPLHGPGVRPFTINGSQTLAFTTARSYLGFQISNIKTGKLLFNVAPPGFTFDPGTFHRTPDHGISLSPDETQLYLIDTPNGYVHVFDVRGLPKKRPRDIANIRMAHPPSNDGWLQHSRDGRYVYVGRAGDVIDTRLRKIVAFLPPLQHTADFLEIDWRNHVPVGTTQRLGVGWVTKPR